MEICAKPVVNNGRYVVFVPTTLFDDVYQMWVRLVQPNFCPDNRSPILILHRALYFPFGLAI